MPTDRPPRVLVVEDEPVINEAVAARFRAEGWQVHTSYDGPSAVAAAEEFAPDLVILDVMLPGFDGHEVCRRIHATKPIPVLMLTARDDETDVLVGLKVGADDYLTKPFSMRELVARAGVLLRRVERAAELAAHSPQRRRDLDGVTIDLAARRVSVDGGPVPLTRTEFDLLACLTEDPGTVLSRSQLLDRVWDWPDGSTRTVDSHVKALRAKIGAHHIRTVHGVGYAWETDTPPSSATP